MFQSRLQGSLRVMRKYRDVLGADQIESRMGTRDWSYLPSQKKVSYTTLALWECVKQLKHFEKKKNVVTTLWQPSDVKVVVRPVRYTAVIGRPFWRWTLRQYVVTKFKQLNLFSISRYNVSQHCWEVVSNSHRICCQIWLYINYEAEGGYHFYLRSVTSFLMFSVSLDEGRNGRRDWSIIDVVWGRA